MMYSQTVKAAEHRDTHIVIAARELLHMPKEDLYALRREAAASIVAADAVNGRRPLLSCAICGTGVRINLHGSGNRYFVHALDAAECPWFQGGRATREQRLAVDFLAEKEGELHRRLKHFIADFLNSDPEVGGTAVVQQTLWSAVLNGKWRRPDVCCNWRGLSIVFELQLGYTHLNEVVRREEFYRAEGAFVIWAFRSSNVDRAVHLDEKYFNRRNLFVLDELAESASRERQRLVLTCKYDEPIILPYDSIGDDSANRLVELSELIYPQDTLRPYFFDYHTQKALLEAQIEEKREHRRAEQLKRESEQRREAKRHAVSARDVQQRLSSEAASIVELRSCDPQVWYERFKEHLDQYQLGSDVFIQRLRHMAGPALDFPAEQDRDVATKSIQSPYFEILLFIRGLEQGKPYSGGQLSLADWLNAQCQGIEERTPQFALVYLCAWYAYPPNQAAEIQRRLHSAYDRVVAAAKSGDQRYLAEYDFRRFVCSLFPRVGRIIVSSVAVSTALRPHSLPH